MDLIRWFDSISLDDAPQVGGKGANLGELTAAGLPVPPGFVITSDAFLDAIDRSGARQKLRQVIDSADPDDPASLATCARRAQELVHATPVPDHLAEAVLAAYRRLGERHAGGRALLGDERGQRWDVVCRHERHLHQRGRGRGASRPSGGLLGVAVRGAGDLVPGQPTGRRRTFAWPWSSSR